MSLPDRYRGKRADSRWVLRKKCLSLPSTRIKSARSEVRKVTGPAHRITDVNRTLTECKSYESHLLDLAHRLRWGSQFSQCSDSYITAGEPRQPCQNDEICIVYNFHDILGVGRELRQRMHSALPRYPRRTLLHDSPSLSPSESWPSPDPPCQPMLPHSVVTLRFRN